MILNDLLGIRRNISIPLIQAEVGGAAVFDSCSMYDVDYDDVIAHNLMPNASWNTKPCQDGWHYDFQQTRYPSIVSDVTHTYPNLS